MIIILIIVNHNKNANDYKNTEYYNITHNSYRTVRCNKGKNGEYQIFKILNKIEGNKKLLFNCYIPRHDGTTTEVDVIMIHETGIYVIESKNYDGLPMRFLDVSFPCRQVRPGGICKNLKKVNKIKFYNPIMQNKVHIKWLKEYLKNTYVGVYFSYIVFGNNCSLKSISLVSDEHRVLNRGCLLKDMYRLMVKNDVNDLSYEQKKEALVSLIKKEKN